MAKLTSPLIVFLPDTRGVEISRYGIGNLKIGLGVYTYSRLAGNAAYNGVGTCPGSTEECERICYAKRIAGPVREIYNRNAGADVPPIPEDAKVLRIHISGDFDSVEYINNWIARLTERPDVVCWAYTRSWRVDELLPALERLRALPNMQLFASMDESHVDVPPKGWRRAWIDGDERAGKVIDITAHNTVGKQMVGTTYDGTRTYVCPEETKHKKNCLECGYCFEGQKNDVTFLKH